MSFFDETKNFGLILLIVSLVGIVLDIVIMFVEIGGTKTPIITGVGSIIGELIVAIYAYGVYTGEYLIPIDRFLDDAASRFGVIKGFVSVYAISSIVDAIFTLIGGINNNLGGVISSIVISLIIAALCIFAVLKMSDATVGTADKVIYYVLMILFILMIIFGILSLIVIVGIIPLVEGIMLLVMLVSPEVKEKFGV